MKPETPEVQPISVHFCHFGVVNFPECCTKDTGQNTNRSKNVAHWVHPVYHMTSNFTADSLEYKFLNFACANFSKRFFPKCVDGIEISTANSN